MSKNSYAEKIRSNYGSATVYIKGKKVMEKGRVLDPEWWREKLKRPKKKAKKFNEADVD